MVETLDVNGSSILKTHRDPAPTPANPASALLKAVPF